MLRCGACDVTLSIVSSIHLIELIVHLVREEDGGLELQDIPLLWLLGVLAFLVLASSSTALISLSACISRLLRRFIQQLGTRGCRDCYIGVRILVHV